MPRRILCGYGIDVDAVSGWLNTQNGTASDLTNHSRGVFGATVGVDRLLNLWDKYNMKTTWFIPAHTVESFPRQMAKIRDAGHEIGLHGYTHEFVSQLLLDQEREVLRKSIDVLTVLTGKKPKGWTAPAWTPSRHSIQLLEEEGILYDHSFMHHDSQMYYVPYPSSVTETNHSLPASSWMHPMSTIKPSSIVEVPANWHLDDWPAFQPKPALGSAGFVDPHHIERFWKEQFEFCYREYERFVFPISIHPQVSGKPQIILMHERLIEWINGHEGVEWCTFEMMVEEFQQGRMGGVSVEGGAEWN
jgi:peptidoglycan/xylan/chitin deacetylase (PgdA/CDA1 family)